MPEGERNKKMTEGYALYQQGRYLMKDRRYEEAVSLFRRSAELAPHFKTFELLGECLLTLGRLTEAIGPLAAATTLNPGVRAPSLLAEAFLKDNQFANAEEFAALALQRDSSNRKARIILKTLEANKGFHRIADKSGFR